MGTLKMQGLLRLPKMAQVAGRVSAKQDAAVHAVESPRQIHPVRPLRDAASRRLRFCKTGSGQPALLSLSVKILSSARGKMLQVAGRGSAKQDAASLRR